MNPFDILIIVIMSFCCIHGLFRGLVKELSAIVGVFAGFYLAYTYYPALGALLAKWISNTAYLNIVSFLIIFCTMFLAISLLGVFIRFLLKISFLSWFDRLCGAIFGTAKGLLIVAVLLTMFTAFLPANSPIIAESLLSPHISNISEELSRFVSNEMQREFTINLKGFKKAWTLRK